MVRRRVVVHGRVQGVGFRWSTRHEAAQLGVSGWVRNLPDGTVQAELEGPEDAVQRMLDWLRHGPPHADVSALEVTDIDSSGDQPGAEPSGFTVR